MTVSLIDKQEKIERTLWQIMDALCEISPYRMKYLLASAVERVKRSHEKSTADGIITPQQVLQAILARP